MRKIISIFLCVCMLFSLVACWKDNNDHADDSSVVEPSDNPNYDESQVPDDVNSRSAENTLQIIKRPHLRFNEQLNVIGLN